MLSHNAIDAIS